MSTKVEQSSFSVLDEKPVLEGLVKKILDEAQKQGATQAEVGASVDAGFSVTARMGDVETVEFNKDQGFAITVYKDQCKGVASTSDVSDASIRETVKAAINIANYTSKDTFSGLADAELMATTLPDLDLYHPWDLQPDEAIEHALACEKAGLGSDKRLINSEGASIGTYQSYRLYGNSHGFVGGYPSSRHSASCVLIGESEGGMQRDYWYDASRQANTLENFETIGRKAAEQTLMRLDPKSAPTGQVPVVFDATVASGLFGHLLSAISGGALYRKSSFLCDQLNKVVFPEWLALQENPLKQIGMSSASFDSDGVATYQKSIIDQGVLVTYLLNSYAARKLNMSTTANGGGARNVSLDGVAANHIFSRSELLQDMGTGLLVTELMGQGVNMVTGDYSRGAAGFWVENGVIQYPVSELTIASNLPDMFKNIRSLGSDIDRRGNIHCGSVLVDGMMVAGA